MNPNATHHGSQTNVLLVDDNEVHRYALSRHLADAGFAVLQANTGEHALQMARQHQPQAVLLDLHLPDVMGFDVGRALRGDAATCHLPLVFFSATHDTQTAKASADGLGAVAFLTYPMDVDHLIAVVRAAVARSRTAIQSQPQP